MPFRLIQVLALYVRAGSLGLPLQAGETKPVRLSKVRVAADGSGFIRDGRPFIPIGLTGTFARSTPRRVPRRGSRPSRRSRILSLLQSPEATATPQRVTDN